MKFLTWIIFGLLICIGLYLITNHYGWWGSVDDDSVYGTLRGVFER